MKSYIALHEAIWSFLQALVRSIICDNAVEYIPNELKTFFEERGIEIKPSAPYAPQKSNAITWYQWYLRIPRTVKVTSSTSTTTLIRTHAEDLGWTYSSWKLATESNRKLQNQRKHTYSTVEPVKYYLLQATSSIRFSILFIHLFLKHCERK